MEEIVCVGSIKELQELTGCGEITDLHREFIDKLTIPSKKGKGVLKRIPEVGRCLTAGLSLDLCLTLNLIIHSLLMMMIS
jgi:hypothetical protein